MMTGALGLPSQGVSLRSKVGPGLRGVAETVQLVDVDVAGAVFLDQRPMYFWAKRAHLQPTSSDFFRLWAAPQGDRIVSTRARGELQQRQGRALSRQRGDDLLDECRRRWASDEKRRSMEFGK
jgi:hypothetical protein